MGWQDAAGVDLRRVDDAGNDVPRGASGEVIVRGPDVTPGIDGLPEVDREPLRNAWLLTCDAGREDEDGFLRLLDRRKDMIVTGGDDVCSSGVERALATHPGIVEVAVIAVPDDIATRPSSRRYRHRCIMPGMLGYRGVIR